MRKWRWSRRLPGWVVILSTGFTVTTLTAVPESLAQQPADGDPDDTGNSEGQSDAPALKPAAGRKPTRPANMRHADEESPGKGGGRNPAPKGGDESADDDEDEEEEIDNGPWTIKVPPLYRGRGLGLRISDEPVGLDRDEIVLKGHDWRERVELIDSAGRVLSDDTVYVYTDIFKFVRERTWKVGLAVGGTTVNGRSLRRVLQDNSLSEFSLDGLWQPGPLGLMASLAVLSDEHDHDPDIVSEFSSSQFRLSGVYEHAPFRRSAGFVKRLHATWFAGLMDVTDSVEVRDSEIKLTDGSRAAGAQAGVDLTYPIQSFWVGLRLYGAYHRLKFEKFGVDTHFVQRGALVEGSYAF